VSSTVTDEELEEIECIGGHTWTRPKKARGRKPKYCHKHQQFFITKPTKRCYPPERVLQEWAEQSQVLDDPGYEERWAKVWLDTVRIVAAKGSSWSAVDVELIEKYVRSLRLAEVHRLYAQDEPYHTTARGTTRPHPGWALAEKEDAKANELKVQLGLALLQNGKNGPKHPSHTSDVWQSRLQQSAEDHEDELHSAVGPDGESL
jgi:hypothetical protein